MTDTLDSKHEPKELLILPPGFKFSTERKNLNNNDAHIVVAKDAAFGFYVTTKCNKTIEVGSTFTQGYEEEICSKCLSAMNA